MLKATKIKKHPTIDIAPVAQWFDIFCSMGANKDKLLSVLGCKAHDLRQKDRRISALRHNEMLSVAAGELNIPGIIMQIGIQTRPENLGVVGHLMKNSESLLEAGRHIVRFAGVLSETGHWDIYDEKDSYIIRYTVDSSAPYLMEIEQASLTACMGTLRSLAQDNLVPVSVSFTHSDPGYSGIYQQVFGIGVQFDRPECFITISRSDGLRSIPHHQSYLLDLLQQHADSLMDRLAADDTIVDKVRRLIIRSLADGKAEIEQVSEQMHMSRWTLARHLKTEGTTFNDIIKETRCEMAAKYLSDTTMSVSEVGFLLGYSEPSAFQRAFRAWYSCTPREFRIQH